MVMTDEDAAAPDAASVNEGSSSEMIRLVLADDHAVVRSGLRMLLDSEPDFEVVAEASNIDDARALSCAAITPGCLCSI